AAHRLPQRACPGYATQGALLRISRAALGPGARRRLRDRLRGEAAARARLPRRRVVRSCRWPSRREHRNPAGAARELDATPAIVVAGLRNAQARSPYPSARCSIFAQESRSVIVRLKTGAPGRVSLVSTQK